MNRASRAARPSTLALALLMARIDCANSIRHSVLGPLWGTVGLAAAIALLGLFFGTILKKELTGYADYMQSLALGLIVWSFLSNVANEACAATIRWLPTFRHSALPPPALALSILVRHLGMLVINLALFLVVQALVLDSTPNLAEGVAGVLLLAAHGGWIAPLMTILAARFRDIGQLLSGGLHVAFFLTPIVWVEHFMGRYQYLLDFNPFYHLLSLVRRPLSGLPLEPGVWLGCAALAVAGTAATAAALAYGRRRLPYWI